MSSDARPSLSDTVCAACFNDADMHAFYTGTSHHGAPFRWRVPKVVTWGGKTGDDIRLRVGLNRYPHNVIGAYVVVLGRQYVLNWKR